MHIYGMHDYSPQWASMILAEGMTGWCVDTFALGCDPRDQSGVNLDTHGGKIKHIARLNNGYGTGGTIPLPSRYDDFAKRCANFIKNSTGIEYVVLANEIQMQWDFPDNQPISLADYIACYHKCYQAIKEVAPHIKIGPAPVATWNNGLKYSGNERGDWIKLQKDIWEACEGKTDAIYIHAYSHGYDPSLITSTQTMDPPFADRYFHFQVYRQLMEAVPSSLRSLPAFITEMNGDGPWTHHNSGWVQAAYAEIDRWNQFPGSQQIHGACLFRWAPHDTKWDISRAQGSISDFRQSLKKGYEAREGSNIIVEKKVERVEPGASVRALRDMNIRRSPGFTGKDDRDVIGDLRKGHVAKICSKSETADNLPWWKIEIFSQRGRVSGWVCEKDPDSKPMIELITSDLSVGSKVRTTTIVNIRSGPGRNNSTIAVAGVGDEFTLADGPRQADGMNWWDVGAGWAAESFNGVDLLEPKADDIITVLAQKYNIDERAARAIVAIESGGSGFGSSGLLIRFENHVFLNELKNSRQREKFHQYFKYGNPVWTGHLMLLNGQWIVQHDSSNPSCQDLEHRALNLARSINEEAAFRSISMGAPQMMGFHHQMMGFPSAKEMFRAWSTSYEDQIIGMFKYIETKGLLQAIRDKNWIALARGYNGTGQEEYYAGLLEKALR